MCSGKKMQTAITACAYFHIVYESEVKRDQSIHFLPVRVIPENTSFYIFLQSLRRSLILQGES